MTSSPDLGLTPIALPDPTLHSLDVIFVHGLNGHRSRTWTNANSELWPLWLAADLTGAGLWTYGYDASIIFGSKDNIALHATRLLGSLVESKIGKPLHPQSPHRAIPIIFVAHSLGGILIKSCMNLAYKPGLSYSDVFNNTAGAIFLGTPHCGSMWANRLFLAQFSFSSLTRSSSFVDLLKAKSSNLATIAETFNNIWGVRPILSCFENFRVLGIGKGTNKNLLQIVKKEDAVTNCREEKIVGVDADHHEICRPKSKDAVVYQIILEFLRQFTAIDMLHSVTVRTEKLDTSSENSRLSPSQKRYRSTIQQVLWNKIQQSPPPYRCDTWITIRNDWISDEGDENRKNWQGGSYICSFPPGSNSAIIQIEIDIREELYPIIWVIQTPPDTEFYPGKHAGRIEVPEGFPMSQPWIIWDTPIFSPFVSFQLGVGKVSSPFDLGEWNPSFKIQHVLQTMAGFLVLNPLCRTPPIPSGTIDIPFVYHELCHEEYCTNEDQFFHAAQFFSRVYSAVNDRIIDNPLVDATQRKASITVIQEMVDFYCEGKSPVPIGRDDGDFMGAFNAVKMIAEWRFEERRWADALSVACKLGFVS